MFEKVFLVGNISLIISRSSLLMNSMIALKLAAQTLLGSAKLLLETNIHPAALKDMVATPGGTTITAIHELESAKIRATLIRAVEAATIKSKSLNSAKTNNNR